MDTLYIEQTRHLNWTSENFAFSPVKGILRNIFWVHHWKYSQSCSKQLSVKLVWKKHLFGDMAPFFHIAIEMTQITFCTSNTSLRMFDWFLLNLNIKYFRVSELESVIVLKSKGNWFGIQVTNHSLTIGPIPTFIISRVETTDFNSVLSFFCFEFISVGI